MNRPVFFAALSVCAGIMLCRYLPISPGVAAVMLAIYLAVLLALKSFQKSSAVTDIAVFFVLGIFLASFSLYYRPFNNIRNIGEKVREEYKIIVLNVISMPDDSPSESRFAGRIISLKQGAKKAGNVSGRVQVSVKRRVNTNIRYGDILEIKAAVKEPYSEDQKKRMFYAGYDGIITASDTDIRVTGHEPRNLFMDISQTARARLTDIIYTVIPEKQARLAEGLLMGSQRMVPKEEYDEFIRTGTVHILAVSGANAAMICITALVLMKFIGAGRRISSLFAALCVWLFCCATGASESIVRASIMASFILAAPVIGRDTDALNALSCAAFFTALISPLSVLTYSFQMSYLAAFGIIYMSPWLGEKLYFFPEYIRPVVTSTVAAQLFVLPVIINGFGRLSIISFIANLAIVPLAGLVTVSGFFMWFAGLVSMQAAFIFGASCCVMIEVMTAVNSVMAAAPWASLNILPLAWPFITVYYGILFTVIHADIDIRIKKVSAKFSVLAVLCVLFISHMIKQPLPPGHAVIAGLRGGNICVSNQNGKISYISAGCGKPADLSREVSDYFRKKGINNALRSVISPGQSNGAISMTGHFYILKTKETDIIFGTDTGCGPDKKTFSCFYPASACGDVYYNSSCYMPYNRPAKGRDIRGSEFLFQLKDAEDNDGN